MWPTNVVLRGRNLNRISNGGFGYSGAKICLFINIIFLTNYIATTKVIHMK